MKSPGKKKKKKARNDGKNIEKTRESMNRSIDDIEKNVFGTNGSQEEPTENQKDVMNAWEE